MGKLDRLSSISGKILGDRCGCCGLPAPPRRFCSGCRDDLVQQEDPGCRFCGTPVPRPGQVCGRCLQRTHDYDRLWFVQDFSGPLSIMIKRLKYHQQLSLGPPLAELLALSIQSSGLASWEGCITAMPMHRRRLIERGFNQSAILAKYVARRLNSRYRQPLKRVVDTPALEGLSRKDRQRTVRNAFHCDRITGSWLLVDDVLTTGASANAAARALRDAGATQVELLCLARTPARGDNHRSWMNRAFHDTPAEDRL